MRLRGRLKRPASQCCSAFSARSACAPPPSAFCPARVYNGRRHSRRRRTVASASSIAARPTTSRATRSRRQRHRRAGRVQPPRRPRRHHHHPQQGRARVERCDRPRGISELPSGSGSRAARRLGLSAAASHDADGRADARRGAGRRRGAGTRRAPGWRRSRPRPIIRSRAESGRSGWASLGLSN